jgi:hypothetical protein
MDHNFLAKQKYLVQLVFYSCQEDCTRENSFFEITRMTGNDFYDHQHAAKKFKSLLQFSLHLKGPTTRVSQMKTVKKFLI